MTERRYLAAEMRMGARLFVWGARTYVMGVINCSPESFSGDGVSSAEEALELARRFADEGADIVDIGGQSTRPGAVKSAAGFDEITPEEEIARTAPVIEQMARVLPNLPISIDTYKGGVARAALQAGAHLVNDISGFRSDPAMAAIVAEGGTAAVLMHNQRGRPQGDVIELARAGFRESICLAEQSGIGRGRLILDPGFGFGWQPEQNIEMIRRLAELQDFELPLLIGTSRKSTIGTVLGAEASPDRRWGTAATVALAVERGVDIVRVHDVAEMKQVAVIADAVVRGWRPEAT